MDSKSKVELDEMAQRNLQSKQTIDQTRKECQQYQMWQHLTLNQREVVKRVLDGKYELMQAAGWGFFDVFMIFLKTIGFLEVLGDVKGEGFKRRMIMAEVPMELNRYC